MITTTKTSPDSSIVMKYYKKYEHLAPIYARQVYDSHKIALDYEDLVQEFRIKIYTCIIAYAQKWEQFIQTRRYRPIPIELYIKGALNNKKKDLYKAINDTPYNLSVEDTGFDFSEVNSSYSRVIPQEGIAEINGINLVAGLNSTQSKCFIMYIYGFPIKKLQKIFRARLGNVETFINERKAFLLKNREKLLENFVTTYKSYNLEEQ